MALGTIFIIIASFSVADKLFIVDFRPFLFFEKFRKNPNKKAAFGAGTPKAAGRNIQFSANAIIPTFACSKLKESLHLHFSAKSIGTQTFMGLFYFFGIGGTNPAPFDLLKSPSGIPRRSCTKNAGQNGAPRPEKIKKRPGHTAQALRYIA